MEPITIIGGSAVGILILQEVRSLAAYVKRRDSERARERELDVVVHQIAELHEWHAKEDDEGVKVWYVRRSLEAAVNKLADNIETMAKLFAQLFNAMEKIQGGIERIEKKAG